LDLNTKVAANAQKAPRNELPYINYKGVCVTDSQEIINYVRMNHQDIMQGIELSRQQIALSHMIRTILENSFYYCAIHQSFSNEEQWNQTKKSMIEDRGLLFSTFVPHFMRSSLQKTLNSQGYGKLPESEVVKRGLFDLQSIEDCLGLKEGPFFLGQQLSLIDITIFAFVAPYLKMEQNLKKAKLFVEINKERFPKLFDLCETIYSRVVKRPKEELKEGEVPVENKNTDWKEEIKEEIKLEKQEEKVGEFPETKGQLLELHKEEPKPKSGYFEETQKQEDSLEDSSN